MSTIAFGLNVKDAAVTPAATALTAEDGTVNSASIDLNGTPVNPRVRIELACPALTVTHLPNGDTVTYVLADSADNSSFTTLYTIVTQTGAGGAGAAAVTKQVGLPADCRRYIRVSATSAGTSGDMSAKTFQLTPYFG